MATYLYCLILVFSIAYIYFWDKIKTQLLDELYSLHDNVQEMLDEDEFHPHLLLGSLNFLIASVTAILLLVASITFVTCAVVLFSYALLCRYGF